MAPLSDPRRSLRLVAGSVWDARKLRFVRAPQPGAQPSERRCDSDWSDLPWQMPGGDLDRVLVPHDGER